MSRVESFDYSSVQSRPKRKLDDCTPNLDSEDDDEDVSDLVSVRMRRDEPNAVYQSAELTDSESVPSEVVSRITCPVVQFFIRMMSEGKTLVIQANPDDTVKSIHERIQAMTGIPLIEQRLIYKGRQLQWEKSLAECCIEKDAGLQLVGRMRSTGHPHAWQVIDDMVSVIFRLCRGETIHHPVKVIKYRMSEFFSMTPKDENELSIGHIQTFMSSSAPAALVMLYISPFEGNKEVADNAIRHFLNSCKISLPKNLHSQCAPIVLEFCKLLRKYSPEDTLYLACRSTLGSLLENFCGAFLEKFGKLHGLKYGDEVKGLNVIQDIFPFVCELAGRISRDLVSSMVMVLSVGPLVSDVRDFTAFLHPLRKAILGQVAFKVPISMPLPKKAYSESLHGDEMKCLHGIFIDLLVKMDKCLGRVEERLIARANGEGEINYSGWSQYLTILRELYAISKIFERAEEQFWKVLRQRKSPLCALILRYARRNDDNKWLLDHKDVTNFESRRYLVLMMFPDVKEDYEELHEMLIDRSQLLGESFEYIAHAEPEALRGSLFMKFNNEEATGPGVLREWFSLVCQALFNPQNALFVACPNDRRRFYPNPASKVDPLHIQYFNFSGRIIGLALMHRVQVGVVFDRVFYLQLAGKDIALEDIRDADPSFYSSCKQILEMDAEFIDSDALGLTFVREVEELGSRKIVELCSGGKSMVVNSENRERYVNLLIEHQFVTSILEQISHFVKGFSDILSSTRLQKLFFQSIEIEDLDRMLFGSEHPICVEDWKAHTNYNGYKENDPQILWFWKIVGGMSPERRKILLFFWTSVKHLPVEGFSGLASRLHIYKSSEPDDRLPTSHTCFYRLCFPPYPCMAVMEDRLGIITQEHVGCSFGAL